MRIILPILFISLLSVLTFAQEQPVEKTDDLLLPTAIELQAFNRISTQFRAELSSSLDLEMALNRIEAAGAMSQQVNEWLVEDSSFINPLIKEEVLKSKEFEGVTVGFMNLYFLISQNCVLQPDGHTEEECYSAELQQLLKTDETLKNLYDSDVSPKIQTVEQLPAMIESFRKAIIILRRDLREKIDDPSQEARNIFQEFIRSDKLPTVEILSESEYGLAVNTRVIRFSSGVFRFKMACVDGKYKVIRFDFNYSN